MSILFREINFIVALQYLMNVILAVDPDAFLPIVNECAQEGPIHLMHFWMLQILAEVHPLAGGNFALAIGDLAGLRRECNHYIQIGAVETELRGTHRMTNAYQTVEFGLYFGFLFHFANGSINEIFVCKQQQQQKKRSE